jgi:hypothetical protein
VDAARDGSLLQIFLLAGEQAENADPVRCPDVDFAVGNHRCDVFVARTEMVSAVGSLAGVVDFDQSFGVVGVEDGGVSVLGGPDDAVQAAVGGEMLGVAPGYPKELAVFATAVVRSFALLNWYREMGLFTGP